MKWGKKFHFVYLLQEHDLFISSSHNLGPTFERFPVVRPNLTYNVFKGGFASVYEVFNSEKEIFALKVVNLDDENNVK